MSKSIKLKNNTYWDSTSVHKDIIVASPSSNVQLVNEYNNIPLIQSFKSGIKLSVSNNSIHIGKGVHSIKVGGIVFIEGLTSSVNYLWVLIRKNGSNCLTSITSGTNHYYQSIVLSDNVIEVSEGDVITMVINNASYATYNAAYVRNGAINTRIYAEVLN